MIDFTALPRRAGYDFLLNWNRTGSPADGYSLYTFKYTGETQEQSYEINGIEQTLNVPVIKQELAHTFATVDDIGEFLGHKPKHEYPLFQVPTVTGYSEASIKRALTATCKPCQGEGASKASLCICSQLNYKNSQDCPKCEGRGSSAPRCYHCCGDGEVALLYQFNLLYQDMVYPIQIDLRDTLPKITQHGREAFSITAMVRQQLPEVIRESPLILKTRYGWRRLETVFGSISTQSLDDVRVELAGALMRWQKQQEEGTVEFEITSLLPAEAILPALEDLTRLHDLSMSIVMREGNIGMCEFGWQIVITDENTSKEIAIDYELEPALQTALTYMQQLGN